MAAEGLRATRKRWLLLLAAVGLVAAFHLLDLGRFLSLAAVKEHQASLAGLYGQRPLLVLGAFFAVYVVATALSLPGAAVLTLAAGAVFGLLVGTVLVSFASSLGATLAFLSSRYILRGLVQRRLGARLADVNAGIERDGPFYLFSLRLVPLIPFFVVNLVMGLTGMRARTFHLVSQVGMLAGTLVYVNAGTQLSRIESPRGILSPVLLVSFVLLGLFPLVARKAAGALQRWRARRMLATAPRNQQEPEGRLTPTPMGRGEIPPAAGTSGADPLSHQRGTTMSNAYRITLPAVEVSTAASRVKEPLEAAGKRMGMIPNMYTRMAQSPGAFETYLYGYERFRKDSGFSSAEQEVVLLTISAENGCEYCVAAHSTLADGPSKVARDVTDAIRGGTPIADARLRALAGLTRAVVATRGRPSVDDVKAFIAAGYTEPQILEIVLAVSVKTISNYVNHLFDTPVDAPFKAREWKRRTPTAA